MILLAGVQRSQGHAEIPSTLRADVLDIQIEMRVEHPAGAVHMGKVRGEYRAQGHA